MIQLWRKYALGNLTVVLQKTRRITASDIRMAADRCMYEIKSAVGITWIGKFSRSIQKPLLYILVYIENVYTFIWATFTSSNSRIAYANSSTIYYEKSVE